MYTQTLRWSMTNGTDEDQVQKVPSTEFINFNYKNLTRLSVVQIEDCKQL
jgi:hypothetical protein